MEFLAAIASGIAGEIGKSIVVPIKRVVSYFISYNRNIKNLEDENKKLGDKKVEAKEFMNDADRKFKKSVPSVPHWHDDAEKLNGEVSQFLQTITGGSNKCCQTPWSRYSLSRKAFKMTEDVSKKRGEAPTFLSYDIPPPNIGSAFNLDGAKDFDSRLLLMNEILEAVRDDGLSMISICGMGGVGKTTVAKKIVRIVESEKLFDLVAITTVSQKLDLYKMQSDIISCFGWKLENVCNGDERARKLHQKFMECDQSSLLIFDDVWSELNDEDFEKIGLPSRSAISGCKIILTSRKADVCKRMGSQKNFPIGVLSDEEAWSLFKEMASIGTSIDNQDLHQTARQISDECSGLPIAIVTVAKALKNKKKEIWNDALLQLKNANPEGISGMEKAVYSRIELSYNLLERKESKSCFLLCCLFPEDHNVPIELLVWYGMGLRIFQNVDSLQRARDRVHVLIDELRESFLLLDGDDSETVRMHDLVRDVALFIASKEEHAYLVRHEVEMRLPETNSYKDYKAISLPYEVIEENPIHLECLKLELLQCKGKSGYCENLPSNFFEGMKELKVLQLSVIESLPQSLKRLEKLRTLICDSFENIKILGHLGNLEILAIRSRYLRELPKEIGLLRNLRLLDLDRAHELEYFPSGVLSTLSKLEELYVSHGFHGWGESLVSGDDGSDGDDGDERINASLSELEYLHVTTLQICVPKPSFLPAQTILASLKRFNIQMGIRFSSYIPGDIHKPSVNKLYVEGDASDTEDGSWFNALSRKTEDLTLRNVKVEYLKNSGFAQLRKILIDGCDELEYLVDNKQISRSHGIELARFPNLNKIVVYSCGKLKYVLPLSMARGLSQLQSIRIESCSIMEGMFCGKEVDDGIEFPNLISLELRYLPKLIGLWADMDNGGCRFLPNQFDDDDAATGLSSTYGKVVSESDSAEEASRSYIVNQSTFNHVLFPSNWIRFSNLQVFKLVSCDQLEVAFPPNVAEQMVQLKILQVVSCRQMQYIIGNGRSQEEKYKRLVFPNLVELDCRALPDLLAFCANRSHVFLDCHSLETITIIGCPKIKASVLFEAINEGPSTLNTSVPDEDKEVKNAEQSSMIRGLKRRRGRKQQKDEVSHINSSTLPMDKSVRKTKHHVSSQDHQILFKIVPDFMMLLNIQKLRIENCNNLMYLFAPHVAKLMVKLEIIRIKRCEKMEGIVAKEHEEAPESTLDKIVFPQLRKIELFSLHNIRSFYGGIYAMEFPLLESIRFSSCNQMKTFSLGSSLSTPVLQKISIDNLKISFMGDLNTTMKMKKEMWKTIEVHDMEHVVRIGHDQCPGRDSSTSLFIRHCGKLLNAIPYNLIASFQNLKVLHVDDCDSLEEIFEYEGGRAVTFSHLERIVLRDLPSLKHTLNKIPKEIGGFQKLRTLKLFDCSALRNVFSVSVASGLLQLQKLVLRGCGELKEVVAKEDDKEKGTSTHQIVFPQLSLIEITLSSQLECFYSGIYAIEFPSLESLGLTGSDCLKSFSNGLVSTPKLEKVLYRECDDIIYKEYYPVNGDLNALISGWFINKSQKRKTEEHEKTETEEDEEKAREEDWERDTEQIGTDT